MIKVRVHIFSKEGVFDPEGKAVGDGLIQLGFNKVKRVHCGKVIDLEIDSDQASHAKSEVQAMCRRILANPVIESFQIEVL